MTFDIGEVLSRLRQITGKYKVFWIIGISFGFFVSIIFPFMLSPILFPVLMPIMIPLFVASFNFIEHPTHWSMLWALALIPLFAFIRGFSMVFTKSAWVLTYLRFTRSPKLQPLSGTVEATS